MKFIETEQQWLEAAEQEYRDFTEPIGYKLISFVSGSKGKNRPRKKLTEIELVLNESTGRCICWNKFPFDVVATEVYWYIDNLDGLELEQRLIQDIRTNNGA